MNQTQNMSTQSHRSGSAGQNKLSLQRKGFVERLDRNGDGKISKSEFDGPSHHFSKFDKNNNGYITEDEAPKRPPRKV